MSTVPALSGPYEWLELNDGEEVDIMPLTYAFGKAKIHPKGTPDDFLKEIDVLRLTYDKDPLVAGLDYIDISSVTLIAQIGPAIQQIVDNKQNIHIKATGTAPKKRFTVQIT